jgi:hypothetical protein
LEVVALTGHIEVEFKLHPRRCPIKHGLLDNLATVGKWGNRALALRIG